MRGKGSRARRKKGESHGLCSQGKTSTLLLIRAKRGVGESGNKSWEKKWLQRLSLDEEKFHGDRGGQKSTGSLFSNLCPHGLNGGQRGGVIGGKGVFKGVKLCTFREKGKVLAGKKKVFSGGEGGRLQTRRTAKKEDRYCSGGVFLSEKKSHCRSGNERKWSAPVRSPKNVTVPRGGGGGEDSPGQADV